MNLLKLDTMQARIVACGAVVIGAAWLAAGERALDPFLLLILAQPVIWLARRPLHDLGWSLGLPVVATLGMALAGGPTDLLAAAIWLAPAETVAALAHSVWVMAACIVGLIGGLRLFQWTHATTLAYRQSHSLSH